MFVVELRYQPTCVYIYDQNVCVCSLPLDYLLHSPTWDILCSAALWYRQGYPSLLPPLHQPGSKDKPGTTPVLCFYHCYTHTHTTPFARREISQLLQIISLLRCSWPDALCFVLLVSKVPQLCIFFNLKPFFNHSRIDCLQLLIVIIINGPFSVKALVLLRLAIVGCLFVFFFLISIKCSDFLISAAVIKVYSPQLRMNPFTDIGRLRFVVVDLILCLCKSKQI